MNYDKANSILRNLPSIEQLLKRETSQTIVNESGLRITLEIARTATASIRDDIRADSESKYLGFGKEKLIEIVSQRMMQIFEDRKLNKLNRVINATGVIIHTNLGRAPLSEKTIEAISKIGEGTCNLEYNLETGKRGRRGRSAEEMLIALTGAEDALIVNNCAAAAVIVLTTLANGGEAIISRGELVEIGGDFRVPDVMNVSGARLVEVGTTNRTNLRDYAQAIKIESSLILKVHPSNYRIIGFTESPTLTELATLAHENGILLYEDAGSGALVDLSTFGLHDEPIIAQSIAAGADVVTFSGDKLLGSVQAGLIVGRADVIERIRKNPLYRALRASKIIYAALEATLESFLREAEFLEVPVLRMLSIGFDELRTRIDFLAKHLAERFSEMLGIEIIKGKSVIGGGAAPNVYRESPVLAVLAKQMSLEELESRLRKYETPIITRIADEKIMIDLRTVNESDDEEIISAFEFALRENLNKTAARL